MFVIRKSQLEAFQKACDMDFEDRMVTHLRHLFPSECRYLDESGLRATIKYGRSRAERYGAEQEYDICLYLHVALVLGECFDENPEHAWARAILDEGGRGAASRINKLHDRVFEPEGSDTESLDEAYGH